MNQETREIQYLTPAQAVRKGYLRQKVREKDKETFLAALRRLLAELSPDNSEDTNKGSVKTFLESSFWDVDHYLVGKKDDIDLAITDKAAGNVVLMFECKKVGDTGMITTDDINRKALHELILYYVLEETKQRNTDVRHLIVTDGYQYFVFDKGAFWKCFTSDKNFVQSILREETDPSVSRSYIYQNIIRPKVDKVWQRLPFTYIELNTIKGEVTDDGFSGTRQFNALYKVFSPIHLLDWPFDKHYTINEGFYHELLYIMGLQEVTVDRRLQIQRMPENKRMENSLVEQAYLLLDDYTFPSGEDEETDPRFEAALGLVLMWINRLIFLKLLEAQLIRFNGGDQSYAFIDHVHNFDDLHTLFFNVLAIPEGERPDGLDQLYPHVPYLNSSLFEMADAERQYFSVNSLRNLKLPLMKSTALRDADTHELPVLDYLLRFLKAYDFGESSSEEGKVLISASVLGLIFEKINGYTDGAYFTPGYVTAYMCRQTLRQAVVRQFNDSFPNYSPGFHCQSFDELKEKLDYTDPAVRQEANSIVNSLRICDPSVGSGHFLVAALNELLAIKRELNILCYENGDRVRDYSLTVDGDELVVSAPNEEFQYEWGRGHEQQLLQETLFREKRTLIENCLFGVDVNPKSVDICRLRLWIELLKNTYYYKDTKGRRHLQTLPNIDINIKAGNALIMHQPLDANLRNVMAWAGYSIADYQKMVETYKDSSVKAEKHRKNHNINILRTKVDKGFTLNSPTYQKWAKAYANLQAEVNKFFPTPNHEKKLEELKKREKKLRQQLEGMATNRILGHAFEWRYEFPEVLNEEGDFIGFDVIIGNPPYGVQMDKEYRKRVELHWEHVPDYEIYLYFIELAHAILKPGGCLSYIISNTWLSNMHAEKVRKDFLRDWHILEVLDCSGFQIFGKATVRNAIITMQRYPQPIDDTQVATVSVGYRNTNGLLAESIKTGETPFETLTNRKLLQVDGQSLLNDFIQNWGLAFKLTDKEKQIVDKISDNPSTVSDFFEVSQGYIPYRLKDLVKKYGQEEGTEIKANRLWHSATKIDDSYIQEIKGEDISRYGYHVSGDYVKYGKHVGTYVDMKFFSSPRLLVREIVNPLIACYVEETFINDPQLINIIVGQVDVDMPLEFLWAIFNSHMATYYVMHHARKTNKGIFPKILIADINDFPLPTLDTEEKRTMAESVVSLARKAMEAAKDGQAETMAVKTIEHDIDHLVCQLYGLDEEEEKLVNS